ncbi:MAG: nucleotidyltransferase family protein [Lachnospiraceae bacterium]|nr:nucleotidyltransferase family protein [Lachnospiraceae bacterium]
MHANENQELKNPSSATPVILGVVAEFNPFHKGHAYLIREARIRSQAQTVIAAMSGNYVQRGLPAIVDKYTRAKMALLGGVDLVAEIPVLFATASAEYFADAGVQILKELGCTHIAFGVETEDTKLLQELAAFLAKEPGNYQLALKECLKNGHSYPSAREKALIICMGRTPEEEGRIRDILNGSNNILAIEYLKAIEKHHYDLIPVMIQRQGNAFNDADADGDYLSATALRAAICRQTRSEDPAQADTHTFFGNSSQEDLPLVKNIPSLSYPVLMETLNKASFILPDDLMGALTYALSKEQDLTRYFDVSEDLANRIQKLPMIPRTYDALLDALECPNLARSRISRALLHILLDIRVADAESMQEAGYLPYIRLLGKKKDLEDVGSYIKHAQVPVITRLAEAEQTICNFCDSAEDQPNTDTKKPLAKDFILSLYERETFANRLYAQIINQKAGTDVLNDFRKPFLSI